MSGGSGRVSLVEGGLRSFEVEEAGYCESRCSGVGVYVANVARLLFRTV